MICDDVCYLIAEDPAAHGAFDRPTETARMVYCQVMSVGRAEFYRALSNGLTPSWVLRLSEAADYQDEKIVLFREKRWRVLRSYQDGMSVELTIGEATVDAGTP